MVASEPLTVASALLSAKFLPWLKTSIYATGLLSAQTSQSIINVIFIFPGALSLQIGNLVDCIHSYRMLYENASYLH